MELTLLLPVVVLSLLALIQVGLVVRDRVLVVHAAREAARAVAVEPGLAAAAEAATSATGLDPARLHVGLGPQRASGDRLAVTVDYRSPTQVPLVGRLVGDVRLSATVTARVE